MMSVRSAATTSRDPPSTRLSGDAGSYSQIAFVFSMTAIFVMCPITATLARFTTCARHLKNNNETSKSILICLRELIRLGIPLEVAADMLEPDYFTAGCIV